MIILRPRLCQGRTKSKGMGKGIVKDSLRILMAKGALNAKAMATSKQTIQIEGQVPSKRLRRYIKSPYKQVTKLKKSRRNSPDVAEILILLRILHAMEGSNEESQREHIFRSRSTIQGTYAA